MSHIVNSLYLVFRINKSTKTHFEDGLMLPVVAKISITTKRFCTCLRASIRCALYDTVYLHHGVLIKQFEPTYGSLKLT